MRRSALAALLATVLMVMPAQAQLSPSTPVDGERVLIDAAFGVLPGDGTAPCMRIGPGRLTVTARVLAEDPRWSTTFRLVGYQGADRPASISLPLSEHDGTAAVPLVGGLYCWSISVDAPVRGCDHPQLVAIRMTLTPQ